MMKKRNSLIFLLSFSISLLAQEVDTLQIKRIIELESTLDSLRQQLRVLHGDLENVKSTVAEGTDLDRLLAQLNDESVEAAPEDQRSRRKRVDALLRVINSQPGQLRFNGGATGTIQGFQENDRRFSTGVGSFDIFAHTNFGTHTLLFFDFEAIGGDGPDHHVNSLTTLNTLFKK